MRNVRELVIWSLVGVAGALLLAWSFPRLFPLLPEEWSIRRSEARAIALERLRDLGEPIEDAYLVVRMRGDVQLERRLQVLVGDPSNALDPHEVQSSEPAKAQQCWDVLVYAPGADPWDWTYNAWIALDGEVLALRRRSAEDRAAGEDGTEGAARFDEETARRRAADFLAEQGFDVAAFAAEPEILRDELSDRASRVVRFTRTTKALGEAYPYGIEVEFEGGEPSGFGFWFEDPQREEVQAVFRQVQLAGMSRVAFLYVLLPIVAIPFLRRYHDGQLGVRRGVQLFLLCLGAGLVVVILNAQTFSEGSNIGFITRRQTTWVLGAFVLIYQFLGLAALGLMSWSVGESLCREKWAHKLASIDALFRLKWNNATVARSSLRGFASGLAMAGVLAVLGTFGHRRGVWASSAFVYGDGGLDSPLPALSALASSLTYFVPLYLFICLLVPCWADRRFGRAAGLGLAILASILLSPLLLVLPLEWGWAMWAAVAAVPVLLFWFGDLLSALLAISVASLTLFVLPTFFAGDPAVQIQGLGALLVAAAPLLVSLRSLGTDREFVYTYDDVPPHVRRIAERERQRVELETARNIQSSILPELPPQLHGVEIAHTYLPATEVGGDFYDVLALDDGRLAVAVGDVAGHGVSSGLVMSMTKSALAVQVTFEPEVEAVFKTLNRMVYQSARRRLLSTLCYALLDPRERELHYASAGHVFPYRVSPQGEVEALYAESYPLGARDEIDVRVRTARLGAGDVVFMYSDGLVEATREGDDEAFGFERLEASLRRHADKPPALMRDAVLRDVEDFTGRRPREDDLTVLVLRLPAA